MTEHDEKLKAQERKEKELPFAIKFFQAWLIFFLAVGWAPYLVLGVHFGALSVALIAAGTAVLTLIFLPFLGKMKASSRNKIQTYKENRDIPKLLATTYWIHPGSALEGSNWLAATGAITEIGESSIPLLEQALDPKTCPLKSPMGTSIKSNPNLRLAAAYCLGRIGNPSSEPALIRALDDEAPDVRKCASEALGRMKGKAAFTKLQSLSSSDPNEGVRGAAAKALGEIGK